MGGALVVAETTALAAAATIASQQILSPPLPLAVKHECEKRLEEEEEKVAEVTEDAVETTSIRSDRSCASSCRSSRWCSSSDCSYCIRESGGEDPPSYDEASDRKRLSNSCSMGSDCVFRSEQYARRQFGAKSAPRKRSMNIQTDLPSPSVPEEVETAPMLPNEKSASEVSEEHSSMIHSTSTSGCSPRKPCSRGSPRKSVGAPPPVPKRGTPKKKANIEEGNSNSNGSNGKARRIVINLDDKNHFTDEVTV